MKRSVLMVSAVVLCCVVGLAVYGEQSQKKTLEDREDILYGWDLQGRHYGYEDCMYTFGLPEEIGAKEFEYFYEPVWGKWERPRYNYYANDVKGALSILEIDVFDKNGKQISMPIRYFQHIDRIQLVHHPERKILIKGQLYTLDELKDDIVVQNEQSIVLDLTDFFIDQPTDVFVRAFFESEEMAPEKVDIIIAKVDQITQYKDELIQDAPLITLADVYDADELSRFPQKTSGEENSELSENEPVVYGYAVDGMHYMVVLPKELETVDFPGRKYFELVPGDIETMDEIIGSDMFYDYEKDLHGQFSECMFGGIPVSYLQQFYVQDLEKPYAQILLKGKRYAPEDLAEYEVYRDAYIVIYNFTPALISSRDMDKVIKKYEKKWGKDYQWIKDGYEIMNLIDASWIIHLDDLKDEWESQAGVN